MGSAPNNPPFDGLRVEGLHSGQPNETLRLQLTASPGGTTEWDQPITIYGVVPLTDDAPSSVRWPVTMGHGGDGVQVSYDFRIPSEAVDGQVFDFTFGRSTANGAPCRPVSWRVTVGDGSDISASVSPENSQLRNGVATTHLTVDHPHFNLGVLTCTSDNPHVTFSPPSITLDDHPEPTNIEVTYTGSLPRGTTETVTITSTLVSLGETYTSSTSWYVTGEDQQSQGDFIVLVDPGVIHISGQTVQEDLTVMVMPGGGFRGDVTLTLLLPGEGSLGVAAPQTNPFQVHIDSHDPVSTTFHLQYTPGQGGVPMGLGTVMGTSGNRTHGATFNIIAS